MKNLTLDVLNQYPKPDPKQVDLLYQEALKKLNKKIVVLDDDPTGVQTVHDIYVYTSWDEETVREGFLDENSMFFILTNSRGFTKEHTEKVHKDIGRTLEKVSKEIGKEYILISRSDSTMRGHYPLETNTLRKTIEAISNKKYHGEIMSPFFMEGGRYTIDNVHYVKEGDQLVPAGKTEFAKDKTFGFVSSNISEYIEEKTKGEYKAKDVTTITLDELRKVDILGITKKLMAVDHFNKIVVNAIDYVDIKVFVVGYIHAMLEGRNLMFRSAAAVPKILGGVSNTQLLTKAELIEQEDYRGGIVLIGSHVNKTTLQFEDLRNTSEPMEFIEFNQHLVMVENGLEKEVERVITMAEESIKSGKNVVVYTRRERFDLDTDDKDKQLEVSVKISDAVTSIIGKLQIKPSFIIAKGGITSSDVGTKALRVKKALVMGQIKPGIPVWMTGEDSKFPQMPYIIFPGNVGEVETLREIVDLLS